MTDVADEVRPVTALFADIVGSTSLGERLRPEEVKVLIGDCVSRMAASVEQYGGMVQAYMGDGICAYFGVPTVREDDADRALLAALQIARDMQAYGREISAAWGMTDFQVRIGVNSGQAAVGMVGSDRKELVALGDMTNVAARLQAAAEPWSIVIGESTARVVGDRYVLEPLGGLQVKGRSEPVLAWRLVRRKASQRRQAARPLVGRQREIAALQTVVADLQAGRGVLLSLRGEDGVGKSCMLYEISDLASQETTWLEGQCRRYASPYLPFIDMLRAWLEVDEGEPEIVVRTRLRARLARLVPDGERVIRYLGYLLGLELETADVAILHDESPEAVGEHIRASFLAWIGALAARAPVVVAIEDMHVADPATSRLAQELLSLTDGAPLLLVTTMRPDPDSAGWRFHMHALSVFPHRVVELSLEPLSEEDADVLAAAHGVDDPAVRRLLVLRSEGNPLYLEELCRALPALGELRSRTWTVDARGAHLPSPLDALLIGRIDRLSAQARFLVQAAAVIGRVFPARVLEAVAGPDAFATLPELLRQGVVRERGRYPEPEYGFRHGMLQEAALSTLTDARRADLYRRVAEAVELVYADSLEERAEVLAHYRAQAGDLTRALGFLQTAAERAESLGEPEHTLRLWNRVARVAAQLGDEPAQAHALAAIDTLRAPSGQPAEPPGEDREAEPATPAAAQPGPRLGRYAIAETIVKTPGIDVYRAATADGQAVALHVLLGAARGSDPTMRRLFERACAAQPLDDRHVVPVLEAAELANDLIIASGWMAGGSLKRRLSAGAALSVAQATWVIARVAAGLHTAHEAGLLHGALTPAAILFDERDLPALTWVVHESSVEPCYIAPEARGGQATAGIAADVYALASTALAAITGRPPPDAPGEVAITGAGEVGESVAWVVGLGRSAEPAHRPRSSMVFAQMLKRAATVAWV